MFEYVGWHRCFTFQKQKELKGRESFMECFTTMTANVDRTQEYVRFTVQNNLYGI